MVRSRIGVLGLTAIVGCAAWAGCALATNGLLNPPAGTGGSSSSASTGSAGASTSGASSSSGATPCTPDETRPCYTGAPGTEDAGPCQGGVQTCNASGNGFGPCTGEVIPAPNNCASGLNLSCEATTPTCSGALDAGGKAWGESIGDRGLGIAVDSQGNVVVTGYFHGTLDFGNGHPLTTADMMGSDAFVAQYAPSGALNWVVQLGGMGDDLGTGVALDKNDNVFVVGSFATQVSFPSSTTVTGGPGIFVAELEPATGKATWGHGYVGTMAIHQPAAVAVSPDDTNLAVVGYTADKLTIGGTTIQTQSPMDVDGFVFTLSSDGMTVSGVQQINDNSSKNPQSLYGVAIEADNSVVVAGQGVGNVSFGNFSNATTTATGGSGNVLVATYKQGGGSTVWQQIYGDNNGNSQSANAVAIGTNGDVFIAGTFQQQIVFGGTTVNGPQNSGGNNEVFVAQLAAATGDLSSIQAFSSTTGGSMATGQGVAVDAYSVVVGGSFTGALVVGSTTMTGMGTGMGAARVGFAMKLGLDVTDGGVLLADGGVLWARPFGEQMDMNESAAVLGVALDRRNVNPLGASAVVGYFLDQVDVGLSTGPVDGGMMGTHIFFARLAP